MEERTLLSTSAVNLVKDVNSIDTSPTDLTWVDEKLFFLTYDQTTHMDSLWETDGTPSGTVDLATSPIFGSDWLLNSDPQNFLVPFDGKIYFLDDGSDGALLYSTDGTAAGTTEVAALSRGTANLTFADGDLFLTEDYGAELWVSNGTVAGTRELTTYEPDAVDSQLTPYLTAVNGRLYFLSQGNGPAQLWTSDGTVAGTGPLTVFPTDASGVASTIVTLGSSVYFAADDGTGDELWTSDGTAAGTEAVPGTTRVDPSWLEACNGSVYFLATGNSFGEDLWSATPETDGPMRVADLATDLSGIQDLTAVGETTFFSASDDSGTSSTDGEDLWEVSQGVATIVTSTVPWAEGPAALSALNSTTLLFWADGGNGAGDELWKSDGTAAATVMVEDINPGSGNSYVFASDDQSNLTSSPNRAVGLGGKAYFAADDGSHGAELWESDGTASGTLLVKDIDPGTSSSTPQQLTVANGTLYFVTHDGSDADELWKSNGSTSGTQLVQSIAPAQTLSSFPSKLTSLDASLFFTANDGIDGDQLWVSNGTSAGTQMLTDFPDASAPRDGYGYLDDIMTWGGKLIFEYEGDGDSAGLYESDGTVSGTRPILVDPSLDVGAPTVVGDSLYFLTGEAQGGGALSLWVATTAGAAQELATLPQGANVTVLGGLDGTLFFELTTAGAGNEMVEQLWASSGTPASTSELTQLAEGTTFSRSAIGMTGTTLGHEMLFTAFDPATTEFTGGESLWASDGTASGTIELHDFPVASSYGNIVDPISSLKVAGPNLFFLSTVSGAEQLWASDGTIAGTRALTGSGTAAWNIAPFDPTSVGGSLFFLAAASSTVGGSSSDSLWVTNGTVAGTVALTSGAGFVPSAGGLLTDVDGIIVFLASDSATNVPAVWASDGTAPGTHIVADMSPSPGVDDEGTILGNALYFEQDGPEGVELWRTDGTRAGTGTLTVLPSSPGSFTAVGQTLFFTATDSHGIELWAAQTQMLTLSTGSSSGSTGSTGSSGSSGSSTSGPGWTTTQPPAPVLIQSVIIGEQPVFQRKLNKKHKPTGKPILTGFNLDLSVGLGSSVGAYSQYIQLDNVTTKNVKHKKVTISKPITNFTVSFLASSNVLTIMLNLPQSFPTGGQLTITGGMTTSFGTLLTGSEVFTVSKQGKSIQPA